MRCPRHDPYGVCNRNPGCNVQLLYCSFIDQGHTTDITATRAITRTTGLLMTILVSQTNDISQRQLR